MLLVWLYCPRVSTTATSSTKEEETYNILQDIHERPGDNSDGLYEVTAFTPLYMLGLSGDFSNHCGDNIISGAVVLTT
jgi:hypothetical protein